MSVRRWFGRGLLVLCLGSSGCGADALGRRDDAGARDAAAPEDARLTDAGGDAGGATDAGVDATSPDAGGVTDAPQPYPEHVVAVYHMVFADSGAPRLDALPPGINVLNIAFAQGDPPAIVDWTAEGMATFQEEARALRATGVRFVISVGGAGGAVNLANRDAFVEGIMALNAELPLDGLDWDVEGPAFGLDDVVAISTELVARRGPDFAITLAPNGSTIDEYIVVARALQDAGVLTMIGQQFYDAPVSLAAAQFRITQIRDAGIPTSRISVGMMVGPEDVYWTVDECVANSTALLADNPGLRGAYLWWSGRDGTADWVARVGSLF